MGFTPRFDPGARFIWPIPVPVQDGSEFEIRFDAKMAQGTSSTVRVGVYEYAEGADLNAPGTFTTLLDDPITVDQATSTRYSTTAIVGGDSPDITAGTKNVIIVFKNTGSAQIDVTHFSGRRLDDILGPRITNVTAIADGIITRIDEMSYTDENGGTTLRTIEQITAALGSRSQTLESKFVGQGSLTVEAIATNIVQTEVGPTGATGTAIAGLEARFAGQGSLTVEAISQNVVQVEVGPTGATGIAIAGLQARFAGQGSLTAEAIATNIVQTEVGPTGATGIAIDSLEARFAGQGSLTAEAIAQNAVQVEVGPTGATGIAIQSLNNRFAGQGSLTVEAIATNTVQNEVGPTGATGIAIQSLENRFAGQGSLTVSAIATNAIQTEVGPTGATGIAIQSLNNRFAGQGSLTVEAIAGNAIQTEVGPTGATGLAIQSLENRFTGQGSLSVEAISTNVVQTEVGPTGATGLAIAALQTTTGNNTASINAVSSVSSDVDAHSQASWGVTTEVVSGGLRALTGIVQRTAVVGQRVISDIALYANRIVLSSGTAVWEMLSDRVRQNVPLEILDGGNGAYIRMVSGTKQTVLGSGFGQNSDLDMWKGDSTVAITNMTLENGVMADGTGAAAAGAIYLNGIPYRPHVVPMTAFSDAISAAPYLTPISNAAISTGADQIATITFERTIANGLPVVRASQGGVQPAAGVFNIGNFHVRAELLINNVSQGWVVDEVITGIQGVREVFTYYEDPNGVAQLTPEGGSPVWIPTERAEIRLNKQLSISINSAAAKGQIVQWRAQLFVDGYGTAGVMTSYLTIESHEVD